MKSAVLYRNDHAHVFVRANTDGTVTVLACRGTEPKLDGPPDLVWWGTPGAEWEGCPHPVRWWNPFSWGRLTPDEALDRAIEAADRYARRKEAEAWAQQQAGRVIENMVGRAKALDMLETELGESS